MEREGVDKITRAGKMLEKRLPCGGEATASVEGSDIVW